MCWGTAGETWGGDLNDRNGNYLDETPFTDVPGDWTNPDEVANAIYEVVKRYRHSEAVR